jgi:uncharacterized protein (TIGR02646 family)
MIRIKRTDIPQSLQSMKVQKSKKIIQEIIESGKKPKSTEFEAHWGAKDVRLMLWNMQHGKCCYCERKRDRNRESDVEHFRPKAEISEIHKDEPGYWWLAYEWSNLFLSCKICNQEHKKNQFPVFDESKRARTKECTLDDESSHLINPEQDDPENYITYCWGDFNDKIVLPVGKDLSSRGSYTIQILGLDRDELLTDRASFITSLRVLATKMTYAKYIGNSEMICEAASEIHIATSPERRYTGFRRAFFRAQGYGEYVNID